ncbi:TPA: hypothetical protein DIV49_01625 [Candidatus Saccharibacteria bacterium]|nr:hypothetical protein [Candidatus Saccharibacteria bacterium]HRJ91035.1 hypothetical protein [Candidatus Saccharibacteria bacterium]
MAGEIPTPAERAERRAELRLVASRLAIVTQDDTLRNAYALYSTGANEADIDYALRGHGVDRSTLVRMIVSNYESQSA